MNTRDKNFTDRKLHARIEQLEASIARYLTELDRADRDPVLVPEARVHHLKEKLQTVNTQIQRLNEIGAHLRDAPDGQISLTDPDARSMATSGRGTGMVGYNVQIAVDTTHHLIVTDEVTNCGHDRQQLSPVPNTRRRRPARHTSRRWPTGAILMASTSGTASSRGSPPWCPSR